MQAGFIRFRSYVYQRLMGIWDKLMSGDTMSQTNFEDWDEFI